MKRCARRKAGAGFLARHIGKCACMNGRDSIAPHPPLHKSEPPICLTERFAQGEFSLNSCRHKEQMTDGKMFGDGRKNFFFRCQLARCIDSIEGADDTGTFMCRADDTGAIHGVIPFVNSCERWNRVSDSNRW